MNWIHYNHSTKQATIDLKEISLDFAIAWRLDHLGSIKDKYSLHEGLNIIDCTEWPSGTWFIRLELQQGVQLKKIEIF